MYLTYFIGTVLFFILAKIYIIPVLFYKGKIDKKGVKVFNYSKYAESFLVLFYFALIGLQIYLLATTLPTWYIWILPLSFCLYWLVQAMQVYINRNNCIKIDNNVFIYILKKNGKSEAGIVQIEKYRFFEGKTKGVGWGKDTGWFIRVIGNQNGEIIELEFDLDELGLEGFKKSIDETLKQNGIPTTRWNE